jgi:hypothetical protein
MVQQRIAAAFWSYVHADDEHENGRITRLRERLERSIQFQSGIRDFRIFQDRRDIGWGQKWQGFISGSLEQALLLFPVITPSFFSSIECRKETQAFQVRQTALGRDDLILPLYYFTADPMEDADHAAPDPAERELAALFNAHQREDWRTLRRAGENDPAYIQAIERMAEMAVAALRRNRAAAGNGGPPAANPTGTVTAQAPRQAPGGATPAPEAAPKPSPTAADDGPAPVRTLTVNQFPGRGDFATITEAVRRAPGGGANPRLARPLPRERGDQ